MNSEPVKTQFDNSIFELNYADAKDRFPKIIEFYALVHEYLDASPLFVPTDGSQVYPNTRYKQNDVFTDLHGSWRHIIDAYYPVEQTIKELLAYFNTELKKGDAELSAVDFKPDSNFSIYGYSQDNYYLNYLNNVGFPYRGVPFGNTTLEVLLKLEPVLNKSMEKFTKENGEDFDQITQEIAKQTFLAKPVGSLTGAEFYKLIDYYLQDRNIKLPQNS